MILIMILIMLTLLVPEKQISLVGSTINEGPSAPLSSTVHFYYKHFKSCCMHLSSLQAPSSMLMMLMLIIIREIIMIIILMVPMLMTILKIIMSKIEKVPRGIRGEKSSKDMASSRSLVSTIGALASPKMGTEPGVRKVSAPCWHATPVANDPWKPLNSVKSTSVGSFNR